MTSNDPQGPSFLGMAVTVSRAMAKFAASGFQRVDQNVHDQRLQICEGCDQHDQGRCHICGCFTDKKAWLPEEDCPLGKWPD